MEYIGQRMICDTKGADGNVYFTADYLEFRARDSRLDHYNFEVYYRDIDKIEYYSGIKKTVVLVLKNGRRYYFYMYRSGTFMELVKSGMRAHESDTIIEADSKDVQESATEEVREETEVVEETREEASRTITDEDLDKLERLGRLHKDQVISDEEFNAQKEAILSKYR